MAYATIAVADRGPVRTLTLQRPARRNAMTPEMQMELIAGLQDAAASSVRLLVITGAEQAFCSGLDLSVLRQMNDKSEAEYRADAERTAQLFRILYELPIPTLAAVNGPAIAGGAGLVLACDFAVAAEEAKFGFTEVRIGFIPALVSAFLALRVSGKHARDLLLTGRFVSAQEALRLGLIDEVVPGEELPTRVQSFSEMLLANSPESLAATKRLLIDQHRAWLDAALAAALEANARSRETADFREGVAAFLEKRKPYWAP